MVVQNLVGENRNLLEGSYGATVLLRRKSVDSRCDLILFGWSPSTVDLILLAAFSSRVDFLFNVGASILRLLFSFSIFLKVILKIFEFRHAQTALWTVG